MKWLFIFSVDLHKVSLDNDKNDDKDDPETIIHVRLFAWNKTPQKTQNLKTSKHLKIQAKKTNA